MTVTIPTPVPPDLTYLHHSQVIRTIPEHPIPEPSDLASRQRIPDTIPIPNPTQPDAPSTFPLSHVSSIPDTYTHSRPNTIQPSLFCIKSTPDISSVSRLQSGKARSRTSLTQCVLVCLFLASIYLYISLCLIVRYPSFVPPSHPQFPVSVNPC